MKTLITIAGDSISSRLDTTREILIVESKNGEIIGEPRTILLDKGSAEDICSLIIREDVTCVVCGGIEDKHYKYLRWKKTEVIDAVIGSHREALHHLLKNNLKKHTILPDARRG